jgi:hypothetical protein
MILTSLSLILSLGHVNYISDVSNERAGYGRTTGLHLEYGGDLLRMSDFVWDSLETVDYHIVVPASVLVKFSLWPLVSRRRMRPPISCSISALIWQVDRSCSWKRSKVLLLVFFNHIRDGMTDTCFHKLLTSWLYDCLRLLACFAKDGHASLVYNQSSGFFTYFITGRGCWSRPTAEIRHQEEAFIWPLSSSLQDYRDCHNKPYQEVKIPLA